MHTRDMVIPSECDDLGLWRELFHRDSAVGVPVTTLASNAGKYILASLAVDVGKDSRSPSLDRDTSQASTWAGRSILAKSVMTSGPSGSRDGPATLCPRPQAYSSMGGIWKVNQSTEVSGSVASKETMVSSRASTVVATWAEQGREHGDALKAGKSCERMESDRSDGVRLALDLERLLERVWRGFLRLFEPGESEDPDPFLVYYIQAKMDTLPRWEATGCSRKLMSCTNRLRQGMISVWQRKRLRRGPSK